MDMVVPLGDAWREKEPDELGSHAKRRGRRLVGGDVVSEMALVVAGKALCGAPATPPSLHAAVLAVSWTPSKEHG